MSDIFLQSWTTWGSVTLDISDYTIQYTKSISQTLHYSHLNNTATS